MAKEFVFRDFVRLTSPKMLAAYAKLKEGVNYAYDSNKEPKVEIQQALKVFESLPRQVRGEVELDFQEVNDLSSAEAIHLLISESGLTEQDQPNDFDDYNQNDKAMWFYLNKKDVFREVAAWTEVDDTGGWREWLEVPKKTIKELAAHDAKLSTAVSEYLMKNELRGENCFVEYYIQKDRICYVAYPEGYGESDMTYDSQNEFQRGQLRKQVLRIYWVYYPKERRLRLKALGKWQKKQDYVKLFGDAVMGDEIDVTNDRVFNLDLLKNPKMSFQTHPEDKVEEFSVKLIRLSSFSGEHRITFESTDKRGGFEAIHQLITDHKIDLDDYGVSQAKFYIKFETEIARLKGTATASISWPNSISLKDNPRGRKLKQYFQEWKIDSNYRKVFDKLVNFPAIKQITSLQLESQLTAPVRHWAIERGIFKQVDTIQTHECSACNEMHDVLEDNGNFFYVCPNWGKTTLNPVELVRWELDPEKLAQFVASEFRLDGKLKVINDSLYQLGRIEIHKQAASIFLLRGDVESQKEALESQGGVKVVLCTNQQDLPPEQNQTSYTHLIDYLDVEKDKVKLDHDEFFFFVSQQLHIVHFNAENGDLSANGKLVVNVTPSSPEYYFIEMLWQDFDKPVSHQQLFRYVICKQHNLDMNDDQIDLDQYSESTPQALCNKLKSLIKTSAKSNTAKQQVDQMIMTTRTTDENNAYRLTSLK